MKDPKDNRSIYISNLPKDARADELRSIFRKCGLIMLDPETNQEKIKIYRDEQGNCKGDAIITFFKSASVDLALTLVDDTELREGDSSTKIKVERATFEKSKPGSESLSKEAKHKIKRTVDQMEKKLEWYDDDFDRGKKRRKSDKIVVLENMFTAKELEIEPALLLDLKDDVREECGKLGVVTNVKLFESSGDKGVMTVKFGDAVSATACVQIMNGRYFGGRKIVAYIYDGQTDFSK